MAAAEVNKRGKEPVSAKQQSHQNTSEPGGGNTALSLIPLPLSYRVNLIGRHIFECLNSNHRVLFKLEGTKSNRAAVGARVTVHAGGMTQFDVCGDEMCDVVSPA